MIGSDGVYPAVSDEGVMEADALDSRRTKEKKSLEALSQTTGRVRDLGALHEFLFSEHAAYATALRSAAHPSLTAVELRSY